MKKALTILLLLTTLSSLELALHTESKNIFLQNRLPILYLKPSDKIVIILNQFFRSKLQQYIIQPPLKCSVEDIPYAQLIIKVVPFKIFKLIINVNGAPEFSSEKINTKIICSFYFKAEESEEKIYLPLKIIIAKSENHLIEGFTFPFKSFTTLKNNILNFPITFSNFLGDNMNFYQVLGLALKNHSYQGSTILQSASTIEEKFFGINYHNENLILISNTFDSKGKKYGIIKIFEKEKTRFKQLYNNYDDEIKIIQTAYLKDHNLQKFLVIVGFTHKENSLVLKVLNLPILSEQKKIVIEKETAIPLECQFSLWLGSLNLNHPLILCLFENGIIKSYKMITTPLEIEDGPELTLDNISKITKTKFSESTSIKKIDTENQPTIFLEDNLKLITYRFEFFSPMDFSKNFNLAKKRTFEGTSIFDYCRLNEGYFFVKRISPEVIQLYFSSDDDELILVKELKSTEREQEHFYLICIKEKDMVGTFSHSMNPKQRILQIFFKKGKFMTSSFRVLKMIFKIPKFTFQYRSLIKYRLDHFDGNDALFIDIIYKSLYYKTRLDTIVVPFNFNEIKVYEYKSPGFKITLQNPNHKYFFNINFIPVLPSKIVEKKKLHRRDLLSGKVKLEDFYEITGSIRAIYTKKDSILKFSSRIEQIDQFDLYSRQYYDKLNPEAFELFGDFLVVAEEKKLIISRFVNYKLQDIDIHIFNSNYLNRETICIRYPHTNSCKSIVVIVKETSPVLIYMHLSKSKQFGKFFLLLDFSLYIFENFLISEKVKTKYINENISVIWVTKSGKTDIIFIFIYTYYDIKESKYAGFTFNFLVPFEAFGKFLVNKNAIEFFSATINDNINGVIILFTSDMDLSFLIIKNLEGIKEEKPIYYEFVKNTFFGWQVSEIICDKAQKINEYEFFNSCVVITLNSFLITIEIKVNFKNEYKTEIDYVVSKISQGAAMDQNLYNLKVDDFLFSLNIRSGKDYFQNWAIDVFKKGYEGVWSSVSLGYHGVSKFSAEKDERGLIILTYYLAKERYIYRTVISETTIEIRDKKKLSQNDKTFQLMIEDVNFKLHQNHIIIKGKKKNNNWKWISGFLLIIILIFLIIFCYVYCIKLIKLSKKRIREYNRLKRKLKKEE